MKAWSEAVSTIDPLPAEQSCGAVQRSVLTVPTMLMRSNRSSSSSVMVRSVLRACTPALATTQSRPPIRSTAAATAVAIASRSEISTGSISTTPSVSPRLRRRASPSISTAATCHPSAANFNAVARPIPEAAPVISTRPRSLMSDSSLFICFFSHILYNYNRLNPFWMIYFTISAANPSAVAPAQSLSVAPRNRMP